VNTTYKIFSTYDYFCKPQIYESIDIKSREEERREERIGEDRRR
jgi:hypothetical protein